MLFRVLVQKVMQDISSSVVGSSLPNLTSLAAAEVFEMSMAALSNGRGSVSSNWVQYSRSALPSFFALGSEDGHIPTF